jgi:hypothetical protein
MDAARLALTNGVVCEMIVAFITRLEEARMTN